MLALCLEGAGNRNRERRKDERDRIKFALPAIACISSVSFAPCNSLVVCGTLVYGFVLLGFYSSTRLGGVWSAVSPYERHAAGLFFN